MSRHVAASSAPVDPIIAQLREQRVGAGMTQRRLARASAVTTSTISSMEDGTHAPTLTVLRRVLGAFGFDLMLVPKFDLSPVDTHTPAASSPGGYGRRGDVNELLCLCCNTSTEQVPDMRACPSCGCSKHPPSDLDDTVTVTLTKHELRILTFWAAEHARRVMGTEKCTPLQTITDRLSLQTSTALSFSQEIADLRAAFPASDVTVIRGGKVVDP